MIDALESFITYNLTNEFELNIKMSKMNIDTLRT
jgi:hypothetical protein